MTIPIQPINAPEFLRSIKDIPAWALLGLALFCWGTPVILDISPILDSRSLIWLHFAGLGFLLLGIARVISVVVTAIRDWLETRANIKSFHLTFNDQHSFWHPTVQPDGSLTVQFALRFLVKNLNDFPISIVRSEIIRPRFGKARAQKLILMRLPEERTYASAHTGNFIPANALSPISINHIVFGEVSRRKSVLPVVVDIFDDRGSRVRMGIGLRRVP